jgi:hypothetical protein
MSFKVNFIGQLKIKVKLTNYLKFFIGPSGSSLNNFSLIYFWKLYIIDRLWHISIQRKVFLLSAVSSL